MGSMAVEGNYFSYAWSSSATKMSNSTFTLLIDTSFGPFNIQEDATSIYSDMRDTAVSNESYSLLETMARVVTSQDFFATTIMQDPASIEKNNWSIAAAAFGDFFIGCSTQYFVDAYALVSTSRVYRYYFTQRPDNLYGA